MNAIFWYNGMKTSQIFLMDQPTPPSIPSARALYDELMGAIEPELTSAVIGTLAEKYASETAEQKQQRLAKYEKAFAAYDKAFTEYMQRLNAKVDEFRTLAFRSAESKERVQEEQKLQDLEAQFASQ